MFDIDKSIKQARNVLFIVGCLILLSGLISRSANPLSLVLTLGVGSGFIFFGFLTRREPFVSILVPLILLILNYIGLVIVNPEPILKGIFWKILFIGILVYSLVNVWKAKEIKKKRLFSETKTNS